MSRYYTRNLIETDHGYDVTDHNGILIGTITKQGRKWVLTDTDDNPQVSSTNKKDIFGFIGDYIAQHEQRAEEAAAAKQKQLEEEKQRQAAEKRRQYQERKQEERRKRAAVWTGQRWTAKSGWCMTNHHTDCQHQFTTGTCSCDCHIA